MPRPEVLFRTVIGTPVGPLVAVASASGLCFLEFSNRDRQSRLEERLRRWFEPYDIVESESPLLARTATWLDEYFAGFVASAGPAPLDLRGTDFERRVWNCLLQVPAGSTFTYRGIAERLGDALKARAVGAAVGANPVSIIVPCHRILGTAGGLTGYGGGLETKRWLLQHETRSAGQRHDRLF